MARFLSTITLKIFESGLSSNRENEIEEFDEIAFDEQQEQAFLQLDCTPRPNWDAWVEMAQVEEPQSTVEILNLFCSDCDLSYRNKMKKAGRCRLPSIGWT